MLFKSLWITSNRIKKTNWTRKPWLKTKTNFVDKLEEDNGATLLFKTEKLEEITFNFSQNFTGII